MKPSKTWMLDHKWIVLGIVGGLVLILIGSFSYGEAGTDTEALDVRLQAYTAQLEEKIEDMLTELDGVSDVHVLLTLEGGASYVYATDSTADGSSRDYVIINNGDTQTPVLLQEVLSDIRGISVVCKNGDHPEVQKKIIGLLCTGFGIPSNRVYVAGS